MSIKHELQRFISGDGSLRNGKNIQTILNHLRRKDETILASAKAKCLKEQEAQILIEFIESQNFGINMCWH